MQRLHSLAAENSLKRWCVFNAVGILGIGIQLATLAVLHGWAGLHYLPATALAVESAVLHNFAWHERWTWADRPSRTLRESLARLIRFNLTNGAISIGSNLLLMILLVDQIGIPYLPANLLAITLCSIVNFLASDRYVFRTNCGTANAQEHAWIENGPKKVKPVRNRSIQQRLVLLIFYAASCLVCLHTPARAAELKNETIAAWETYVRLSQDRIAGELCSAQGFLVRDFLPGEDSAGARAALRRGEILVKEMRAHDADGTTVSVPFGMIHHWLGSVFIPNANLDDILEHVRHTGAKDHRQEDVLESRVLSRDGDSMRIYLKLTRLKIVTVTYNTEHLVQYHKHDDQRASSCSTSLRIAELEHANTIPEREKPEGRDSGFLWRLNSYWRYEQAAGGVFIECESISLSRGIPFGLSPIVRPIINRIARESMARTLRAMRERFSNRRNART